MVVFPFVLAISPIEVVWIDNNREFWQPPVMDLVHGHDVLAVMVTDPLEAWIYVAFGCLLLWRAGLPLIHWLRSISIPADPWDAETSEKLNDPDAIPVCHHCFTPQEHDRWLCPECGAAVGPYNNYLPLIRIFSLGEVARLGSYGQVRRTPLTIIGFLVFGISEYNVFAPIYWYSFLVNLRRCSTAPQIDDDLNVGHPE